MKETVGGSLCKFYHVHSGRLCILWWLSIAKKCVWVNLSIEAYAIFRQLHQQIYTLESYIVDALMADLFVTLLFLAVGALPFSFRSAGGILKLANYCLCRASGNSYLTSSVFIVGRSRAHKAEEDSQIERGGLFSWKSKIPLVLKGRRHLVVRGISSQPY